MNTETLTIYITLGLFIVLLLVGMTSSRPYTHTDCGTDTCAVQGHLPVVNPQAPTYTD